MSVLSFMNKSEQTMTSLEIAELTGKQHKHVMTDIRNMLEALEIHSAEFSAQYKDSTGRSLPCFELNRYYTEVLVTGYDVKRRAAVIKRWHDLETGAVRPRHGIPRMVMADAVEGVAAIAKHLNYSNSGKAEAFYHLTEHYGIPGDVLKIEYAVDEGLTTTGSSRVTKNITDLLSEHGARITARKANSALLEMGYLEEHSRRSNSGKEKKFKAVSDAGQKYGKNITHRASQGETQPHWFVDSFSGLLEEISNYAKENSKSNVVNYRTKGKEG
jgi:hypothetical protein